MSAGALRPFPVGLIHTSVGPIGRHCNSAVQLKLMNLYNQLSSLTHLQCSVQLCGCGSVRQPATLDLLPQDHSLQAHRR